MWTNGERKADEMPIDIGNSSWMLDPAIYLDSYLSISHLITALIGIPLNLIIAVIIIWSKNLRNARNFSWLGIGLSSIFLLLSNLSEFLAVHWPTPAIQSLCSSFQGLPYHSLLLNLFISLLERHLCLKFSRWHSKWVAGNCWIIPIVQIGSFAVLCMLIQGRHLFEAFPFQWQVNLPDLKVLSSFILASFILCWAGHATLWASSSRDYPPAQILDHSITINCCLSKHSCAVVEDDPNGPFVLIEGERVSQLDVEAARTITLSGFIILSSYIPSLVGLAYLAGCLGGMSESKVSNDCTLLVQIMYYQREIISIPCFFVIPIYFFVSSRDLRSAFRNRRRQCFPETLPPSPETADLNSGS